MLRLPNGMKLIELQSRPPTVGYETAAKAYNRAYESLREAAKLFLSQRSLVISSLLFFYGVYLWVFLSTGLCQTCAASQLWKYSVLASSPITLLFVLVLIKQRTLKSIRSRGAVSMVISLATLLYFAASIAPEYTLVRFAQRYDIVYFDLVAFPFSSAMILFLTATLGLISFNLSAVWGGRESSARRQWSVMGCWKRVSRNWISFLWFVLLLYRAFPTANEYRIFGILMISTLAIPFFGIYSSLERHHRAVRWLIGGAAGASLLQIFLDVNDFLAIFAPPHPFAVVPLASFLAVGLASALGEIGTSPSVSTPSKRRGKWSLALSTVGVVVAVYITWAYSHAAIVVFL